MNELNTTYLAVKKLTASEKCGKGKNKRFGSITVPSTARPASNSAGVSAPGAPRIVSFEINLNGYAFNTIGKEFAPIKLERTRDTKLKHKDGTISMARDGPDTATSDFFLCIGDQPELDFGGKRNPDGQGFAAFGKVIRGMDVVKKIQAAPADGQSLKPAIKIHKVARQP